MQGSCEDACLLLPKHSLTLTRMRLLHGNTTAHARRRPCSSKILKGSVLDVCTVLYTKVQHKHVGVEMQKQAYLQANIVT